MTDVPPISVGASVSTPRYQDTFAVPVEMGAEISTGQFTSLDGGDTDNNNNGGSGTGTLVGTGTTGLRLWVRSPADEWIVLPVGAGEDLYLRSLNVYDKERSRWMTPTPPYAQDVANSLDVRAPGVTWTDTAFGEYNPNWNWQVDDYFFAVPADYVRLSHMSPRVDPDWRVVNVGRSGTYPVTRPSMPVHGVSLLEPLGGVFARGTTLGGPNPDVTVVSGDALVNTSIDGGALIATDSRTLYGFNEGTLLHMAGMIDLRSITEQLATRWRESNYGVGQYTPIDHMQIRRVELGLRVDMFLSHGGGDQYYASTFPDLLDAFQQFRGTLHVGTNSPGFVIPEWPYTPQVPISEAPFGAVVYDQFGIPGDIEVDSFNAKVRTWAHLIRLEIDPAGLDGGNVTVSVNLDNIVEPNYTTATVQRTTDEGFEVISYPAVVRAGFSVVATDILIHYASPGHDVPSSEFYFPDGENGTGVYVMDES